MSASVSLCRVLPWRRYFNNAIPDAALKSLLYVMTLEDVQALSWSLSGNGTPSDKDLRALTAAFVKYGRTQKVLRALDYLMLAKRVEPIATRVPGRSRR